MNRSASSSGAERFVQTSDEDRPVNKRYLSWRRSILVSAIGFSLLVLVASWYRHATYRSTSYDLGVFDQALWLLAHGKSPFVTLIGTNIFFDHFSPVLVAFVPLYWIAATPFWLILVQSL